MNIFSLAVIAFILPGCCFSTDNDALRYSLPPHATICIVGSDYSLNNKLAIFPINIGSKANKGEAIFYKRVLKQSNNETEYVAAIYRISNGRIALLDSIRLFTVPDETLKCSDTSGVYDVKKSGKYPLIVFRNHFAIIVLSVRYEKLFQVLKVTSTHGILDSIEELNDGSLVMMLNYKRGGGIKYIVKDVRVIVEDKTGYIIKNPVIDDGDSGKVIGREDLRAILNTLLVIVYLIWIFLVLKLVYPLIVKYIFKKGDRGFRYLVYLLIYTVPLVISYLIYDWLFYFIYHDGQMINFIYQLVAKLMELLSPIYK